MLLTKHDVIERLRSAVAQAGSQQAFAERERISTQYVSDVLHGRREPGQKLLDTLGLDRVVRYRERY